MPDVPLFLTVASTTQIAMMMLLLVAILITVRVLLPPPDIHPIDEPVLLQWECRDCGEVLRSEANACPVCGGRTVETPAE